MIKRALIIAPHPDDEINLAGQLNIKMNKLGIEMYVVYTTNGDAEPKIGNKRIVEAISANGVLGIQEDHVIFLGYPNEWQGEIHIYNAFNDEVLTSRLGKKETNSIASHPEFCFTQFGVHHKFTRENFKSDLKSVIKCLKADLLIAPEFDSHPDHRAASLMFDEVLGEILKENIDYRPIVFKKYIHEGVWYGPKDYYQMLPTVTEGQREYAGGMHDLDSPCFSWDERIVIPSDEETLTPLLKDNIVYKAAKKHKVTIAWYEMQRVLNSDIVYWPRRTDNLALTAEIRASSGDVSKLNDFKLYDSNNVIDEISYFDNSGENCWIPDKNDFERKIDFCFNNESKIERIIIYRGANCTGIKKAVIYSDDVLRTVEPINTLNKSEIQLDKIMPTKRLSIQILEYERELEITEIEIYSSEMNEISNMFTTKGNNYEKPISTNILVMQKVERLFLGIKFLFGFKIQYEIKRRMKNG